MQAAIIPADPTKPVRFEDIDPAQSLDTIVGDDFQLVGLRPYSMNMYVNENGKLEHLPVNLRATVLCNWAQAIRTDDYINGDAVLLGPINEDEGEDTGLADVQVSWLQRFDAELSVLNQRGGLTMAFAGALAAVQMSMVNQQKRTCPVCRRTVTDRELHSTDPSGQRTHTDCEENKL
jgi:hypothetical protein